MVQIFQVNRDRLHIGPLAAELAETAFEFGDVVSIAARALGKENKRTAAVEFFEKRREGFAPGERRYIEARNQDRPEDAGGEIRSQRSAFPIFVGRDGACLDTDRLRERRPEHDEIEVAGMVCEVHARPRLEQGSRSNALVRR